MYKAALVFCIGVGVMAGLGGFTLYYARGLSYLSDDPKACVNCHIMQEQYDGWIKSSHRQAATCNDCHTPPGFVGKYSTKALNGVAHSTAFTTGWYPENIDITARNKAVALKACQKCHADITQEINGPHTGGEQTDCTRCHASVGHKH
jgi:cytochrome c nitrite reductase small subunit